MDTINNSKPTRVNITTEIKLILVLSIALIRKNISTLVAAILSLMFKLTVYGRSQGMWFGVLSHCILAAITLLINGAELLEDFERIFKINGSVLNET
jgi:hypothetical protein